MKKIKLIAASLLASTLVMSGCSKNDHEHTFAQEWSHDNEKHWHSATCEHTDLKSNEEAHKDDNKNHKCDVCDFVMSDCVDSNNDHKCDICGADLPYISSVSISGAPETLARGESVTLKVNVQAFSGASKDVTWSVDKAELASVDENGKVTALANGVVVVTATSVSDSSKKGSASIKIVDPDWSDDLKEAMEDSLGMVLPYFDGDFEWSVDEEDGSLLAVSENEADTAKVIEAYDKLQIEKEVEEDYVEFTFPSTISEDLVVAVDVYAEEGKAYVEPYLAYRMYAEWPAEKISACLDGYTTLEPESVPAAEGTKFGFNESAEYYYDCYVLVYGSLESYVLKLMGEGWTVLQSIEGVGVMLQSPKTSLNMILMIRSDEVFQAEIYAVGDPVEPITEWPAADVSAFIGEHTEETVPAAVGTSFKVTEKTSPYSALVIDVTGDISAYLSVLEGAEWQINDLTASYGYYDCYSPEHYLELAIFPGEGEFEIQLMLSVPPAPEWPADLVAALLDGKTEVEIPEAEGTSFVVAPLTGFYFGSITISGGDMDTYLETLRSAEFSVVWDSSYQCYVAAKGNLLMDIGENPDVEGEFQMLLYLKAAFPTADVAAAVEALVPGSETVIPEFEAEEYQLQDVRGYIGAFILYASGDSSLLNEYVGILDDAEWAVSELEEGVYGAVSPAEDIMLQISYSDYYGELNVYIMTYTKPATEWPADDVAALVESIEADGTVPAADGLSFTCYEAQGYYPPQINVVVEEGTAEAAAAAYVADLEDAGFFLVMSSYGYDYYAEEGNTLALCVYVYGDDTFIIELGCLASPAVKPLTEWPADAIASIVENIGAEGSTVPVFEGEGVSFELGEYWLVVNPGENDPEDLLASYIAKLQGLGYFACGVDYGPIFALEGETLGISPYYAYGNLYVDLIKLDSPAAPAVFPTAAVEEFFNGKTDEVVPAITAYGFNTSDKTSYLEIQAQGGNVKDYMKVLSDAGWTADYDSSAYYNYATSPEGSIKMTLINYTSYVTLKLEYVPPKLTEWPADAIAEALGEKAKTTLPGITGEGLQFEFTDNGDDSMKLDVYGSTPTAYVSILEDAGFTVTEGSEEDQYWYLLSEDKTVKVQVYDYMSAGQDYFRVKAYGQDPTWTGTSFDPAVVEEALGLSEGFIPAIADGTKFSFSQPSNDSFKVTVESGANYSNFIAALGAAGFEETSAGSNTFTKDNVVATVKIENPITQKYSLEYTVQSSPTPQGEWPLDQIKALLGDERGELLPEAVGATSVIVTGSDGDCNISFTGVSAQAYKQALLDAGFSFDGMSYSKGDLYVDVTGSGDSCTVNAYYF